MKIFLFIIPLLAIALGANWLVGYSLIRMFLIKQSSAKILIYGVLLAMFFLFIAVSALSHFYESKIVSYTYTAISVYMGFFVFVFFALIIGWIFIGLFQLTGLAVSSKLIALVMLVLAVLYSAYNIWNAFDVQVKNISVQITNLPDYWKNKKIVQLSDIHLGNVLGVNFLNKIVQETNAQNPDMIFITGDLFDGMDGDLDQFIGPLNNLKAKDGVYFITGNHEIYLPVQKALDVLAKTDIKYIDDKIVHVNGLQIIGIGYLQDFTVRNIKQIVESNPDYDSKMPTILLYHIPLPSAILDAKNLGVNLYLAGHTHVGQLLPFKLITDLVYKGYDYGLHQEGSFYEYTSSGAGTWGPPMRSGNQPEIVVIDLK